MSSQQQDVTIVLDAEASRTVQVLVEQYGFDLERSVEAVQALGNKSDVGLAVSWLLDGGEEDRGGAVEFVHCPHLDGPDSAPLIDPGQLPAYNGAKCSVEGCASTKEPWVCLHCAGMFGSRYACGHALTHFESMRSHTAALSLSDLSVWCYACSAYVHHERLHDICTRMEGLKFGGCSASSGANAGTGMHATESHPEPANQAAGTSKGKGKARAVMRSRCDEEADEEDE